MPDSQKERRPLRTHIRAAVAAAAGLLLVGAAALPASATGPDASDTTTLGATVTAGAISVGSDASVSFSAQTLDPLEGEREVSAEVSIWITDLRAATTGYTVTWAVTDFTTTPTNGKPIPATALTVSPDSGSTDGTVIWTAGTTSDDGSGTIGTASGVSGVNAIETLAYLDLALPGDALAGAYSATMTISVTVDPA